MTREAIGVDVGGTRIRVARIDASGRILAHHAEPVAHERAAFTEQLVRLIGAMRTAASGAIGIGIPGRVRAGQILSAGYLDIAGLDVAALCRDAVGLGSLTQNDAAMALVAEAHARPDGQSGVLAMVTVGTGIGGAVAVDGRLWHGGGVAGQFGHVAVAEGGPVCNCGRRGCVETTSSGTAFARIVEERGLPAGISVAGVRARAEAGDGKSALVLDLWARPFRRAIDTLAATLDPRALIVGGGLGGEMVEALRRVPHRGLWFDMAVEPALLGDDAGVIGAGLLALRA